MRPAVVALLVPVFALAAIACRGGDTPPDPTKAAQATFAALRKTAAAVPLLKTVEAQNSEAKTDTAKRNANVTPTIPESVSSPVTLMFCVPLQQIQHDGPGGPIASVPDGSRVIYRPGTCEPDVNADGHVAVRADDGAVQRVAPVYTTAAALTPDQIVWTPAIGDLNGTPVVMTAKYIKRDAQVQFDQLGSPLLTFNMTPEGRQVFSSLTRRIGSQTNGLPLAMFLDGAPVHGASGHVVAPTVQSEISDTGQTTGLFTVDAQRLAALFNSGMLR